MPNPSATSLKIISPQADGSYYQEKAAMFDKYCIGKGTGILRMVPRDCVFPMMKPIPFDTLEALRDAENPDMTLEGSVKVMLAGHENPWPVTFEDEYDNSEEIREEMRILNRTTRHQRSQEAMVKTDNEAQMARVMMMIAIPVALLAAVFGLIVMLLFVLPRLQG